MRLTILLSSMFLFASLYCSAQKKVNRQYFINLLNAGEYDKVFDTALKLRKQVYGKNAVIDYFIAKSLCLDGHHKKATHCFHCIINNFKLDGSKKSFIQKEISNCNAPSTSEEEVLTSNQDFSYINNVSLPEAGVSGKMGRVYNCESREQTINLSKMVVLDELESRLFPITEKKNAVNKIRSIVNDKYRLDTSGRYVFVSLKKYALDSVSNTASRLENAYNFFVKYYGLRPPDKLLTVYILPDKKSLRETAELVHGIQLPDPNIGYSNLSDLSLLGLGDAKHLGTLYHELFHLIVRTDLGDIPAFLDEGLASLYSVSKWKSDLLIGDARPWRLDEIREARNARDRYFKIPTLDSLINYSWNQFDGQETKNVCQVAVNYALSNFLMIYLQEKNRLQQMVDAFKNRPFILEDSSLEKTNIQIFEEVVQDSIKTFSLKFDTWFKNQYGFNLYSGSSIPQKVHIPTLFDNAWALLYKGNEMLFKSNATFVSLKKELTALQEEYRKPDAISNSVNQTSEPSNRDNIMAEKLYEFDRKLRKLIFDNSPKTAN